jgi:protein phosphatase
MPLSLHTGACTLQGNYRAANEDAVQVVVLPDWTVCLVADGMGGPGIGDRVSQHAVALLARELSEKLVRGLAPDRIKTVVRRSIVKAHEEILALHTKDRRGGSSLVLSVWPAGESVLYLASVGDCSAYLLRGSQSEQLTVIDDVVQFMADEERVSRAEALRRYLFRNVLLKFLGSEALGDGPEVAAIKLQAGDRLLLCTDGLYNFVPQEEMFRVVRETNDVQQCANALGQSAVKKQARDNISCIVIEAVKREE